MELGAYQERINICTEGVIPQGSLDSIHLPRLPMQERSKMLRELVELGSH